MCTVCLYLREPHVHKNSSNKRFSKCWNSVLKYRYVIFGDFPNNKNVYCIQYSVNFRKSNMQRSCFSIFREQRPCFFRAKYASFRILYKKDWLFFRKPHFCKKPSNMVRNIFSPCVNTFTLGNEYILHMARPSRARVVRTEGHHSSCRPLSHCTIYLRKREFRARLSSLLSLFNTVPLHSLRYDSQRLNRCNRGLVLVYILVKGVDRDCIRILLSLLF